MFPFAPFKHRSDHVVGLAFRYDPTLVERLKAVLRTARAAVQQAHPAVTVAGGWLPQYGVWFCEVAALPAVLKALTVAGYRARWVTAPPWDVDPGAGQERHQAGGAGEPARGGHLHDEARRLGLPVLAWRRRSAPDSHPAPDPDPDPEPHPAPDPGPPPSPDRDHDRDHDPAPVPVPWPDDWPGRGAWWAVPPDDWGPTDSERADGSPVYRVLCPCGATPLLDGDGVCPRCQRRYRIRTAAIVERWEPD